MRILQNVLIALIYLNVPIAVLFLGFCMSSALARLPLAVWLGGCLSLFIGVLGVAAHFDEVGKRQSRQHDR